MKSTPKLNSFKVRERSILRKKRGLTREMEVIWSRKAPGKTGQQTAWSVLRSLVSDLSSDLDPLLVEKMTSAANAKDIMGYLRQRAEFGDVQLYKSPRSYFAATSVLNLLKKFPWVSDEVDPLKNGIARFYEAEMLCKQTNRRFRHYRKFDFHGRPLVKRLHVHEIFHLARRKIESWIGSEPEFREGKLNRVKHGPGGSIGLRRPFTTPYYKFSAKHYTVSTGAYFHAARVVTSCDSWVRALAQAEGLVGWNEETSCIPRETKLRLFDQKVEIANYNKVTFVLKNAETHRAIAIEPSLQMMLQLEVGDFFRSQLLLAGCNLNDQSRNQELARVGSIQGDEHDPVTLDQRMASDCMAIELVRELTPIKWFDYLDQIRSREGLFNGTTIKWEKFSSMGNGFTFELESMIFYALAQSVSDFAGETDWFRDTFGPAFKYAYVSVYGDDIIVPKRISAHLIAIYEFCGFKLNREKSFTAGQFRESCGKDYYDGVLVRPYQCSRGLSQVKDLIHLHNSLKGFGIDGEFDVGATLHLIRQLIPRPLELHLRGPHRSSDDNFLWCEPDECHQSFFVVWDTDMQTWTYPTMRNTLTLSRGNVFWRYCQFLYSGSTTQAATSSDAWSTDQFALHVSGGGSAGDVVLSGTTGEGVLTLAT